MLISSNLLIKSHEKYQSAVRAQKEVLDKLRNSKKGNKKEQFEAFQKNSFYNSFGKGAAVGSELFYYIFAIVLFIVELVLIFYLFGGAIKCTRPGPERILHILLIIFFTGPYALLTAFFGSPCMLGVLRNTNLNPKPSATFPTTTKE